MDEADLNYCTLRPIVLHHGILLYFAMLQDFRQKHERTIGCTTEPIDALCIIANDSEIATAILKMLHNSDLYCIGVLYHQGVQASDRLGDCVSDKPTHASRPQISVYSPGTHPRVGIGTGILQCFVLAGCSPAAFLPCEAFHQSLMHRGVSCAHRSIHWQLSRKYLALGPTAEAKSASRNLSMNHTATQRVQTLLNRRE